VVDIDSNVGLAWFWDTTQLLHREQVRESSIPSVQQQLFLIRLLLPVCKFLSFKHAWKKCNKYNGKVMEKVMDCHGIWF